MFELIMCDQDGLFGVTKWAVMQLSATTRLFFLQFFLFFLTPLSYKYLISCFLFGFQAKNNASLRRCKSYCSDLYCVYLEYLLRYNPKQWLKETRQKKKNGRGDECLCEG